VRDQALTLLFAGHDTTTTTFTFLAHQLGRNPGVREAVEAKLGRVLSARNPPAAELDGHAPPVLERSLKATLRRATRHLPHLYSDPFRFDDQITRMPFAQCR
jgi:cytochrome P450